MVNPHLASWPSHLQQWPQPLLPAWEGLTLPPMLQLVMVQCNQGTHGWPSCTVADLPLQGLGARDHHSLTSSPPLLLCSPQDHCNNTHLRHITVMDRILAEFDGVLCASCVLYVCASVCVVCLCLCWLSFFFLSVLLAVSFDTFACYCAFISEQLEITISHIQVV